MTKKIILLLVEGSTDKDTLALIFSKLVKNHNLEFEVLRTDITADESMTVKYIEKKNSGRSGTVSHKESIYSSKRYFEASTDY